MTRDEIMLRIERIRSLRDDPEAAHSEEDALREDFIRYVSTFDIRLADKAALVLTTKDIEFPRWTA